MNFSYLNITVIFITLVLIFSSFTSMTYSIESKNDQFSINKISIFEENAFSSLSRSLITEDNMEDAKDRRKKKTRFLKRRMTK